LGGFNEHLAQLKELNASVVAISAESEEKAAEVAAKVSFPVAYGLTKQQADGIGSWWEDRRSIVQPSDFVLNENGGVLSATYSSGPIGRLEAADAIRFIEFQEKQKQS